MTSLATRAAVTLLTLALALCLATPATAIPTPSYSMVAGVSGSSYFWQFVDDLATASPTVAERVNTAIQSDLQAAAGTDVTVAYTSMLINASAMYVQYDATVVASTPSEATVHARIATTTFPSLTSVIASMSSSFTAVSDLVPTALAVTNPLPVSPTWDDSSSGYTYTGSVSYDVVVMFTGEPAAWTTTLASSSSAVTANIVASVQTLLDSSKQQNAVTVSEMHVLAADSKYKTMGSGAGGLIVSLHVVCYGTTAMTGRYLSTSEYASVLLSLGTSSLMATYRSASGSSAIVVVEETTTAAALGVSNKCDNACKGMIAMTAVIVFLAVVCATIVIIAIACPCGFIRSAREGYLLQKKSAYGVHTEVAEAIYVYGEDRILDADAHEPTTAHNHSRRASSEPAC